MTHMFVLRVKKQKNMTKKILGPIFGPQDRKIVKISAGNNSSNSKALNLKF